jgi:hypothetical protein
MESRATRWRKLGLAIVAASCAVIPAVAAWVFTTARGADQNSLQLGMVLGIIAVLTSAFVTIGVYGWVAARVTDRWAIDDILDPASAIVAAVAFIGLCATDSALLLASLLASIVGMRGGMKQVHEGLDIYPIGRL